jgi:hypothetical protein
MMGVKELLERDFDKEESGLGEICIGDSGLGGSLESELRGLDEELVERFDTELIRWDEVKENWRISEEEYTREARPDSTL